MCTVRIVVCVPHHLSTPLTVDDIVRIVSSGLSHYSANCRKVRPAPCHSIVAINREGIVSVKISSRSSNQPFTFILLKFMIIPSVHRLGKRPGIAAWEFDAEADNSPTFSPSLSSSILFLQAFGCERWALGMAWSEWAKYSLTELSRRPCPLWRSLWDCQQHA